MVADFEWPLRAFHMIRSCLLGMLGRGPDNLLNGE